ncbi:MAG: DsbA family protein [Proteobacteria bacterium]|nr:DsbA family protein [Pseudomonadota bacterium]
MSLKPIARGAAALAAGALALLLVAATPALAQGKKPGPPLSPEQARAVEQILRDTIEREPEIVLRAIDRMRERQARAAAERTRQAIALNREALFNDPDAPVAGNAKGDVVVVEFFDYRCPYCKQVAPELLALLRQDDRVKLVYKEIPVLGPQSVVAARAALAAHRQGKYKALHDALMAMRGNFSDAEILQAAAEAGVDVKRLKADMARPEIEAMLRRNLELANRLGIDGTPAFVVGDRLVPGAINLAALKQLVAAARGG